MNSNTRKKLLAMEVFNIYGVPADRMHHLYAAPRDGVFNHIISAREKGDLEIPIDSFERCGTPTMTFTYSQS